MFTKVSKRSTGVPLFFIAVIAMPFVLYVSLLLRQQWLQHEMLEKLETSHLTTIIIKKDKLAWVKNGKELITDGKLVDVKEITETSDCYVVKGIYDKAEDELVKLLNKTADHSSKIPLHQLVSKLAVHFFWVNQSPQFIAESFTLFSKAFYPANAVNISLFSPAINIPPPKV